MPDVIQPRKITPNHPQTPTIAVIIMANRFWLHITHGNTTLPCVKMPTNDRKGAEYRAKQREGVPEPAEAPPRPTPRRRKLAREGPDAGKGAPDRAPKRAKDRPTASCTVQAQRRRAGREKIPKSYRDYRQPIPFRSTVLSTAADRTSWASLSPPAAGRRTVRR